MIIDFVAPSRLVLITSIVLPPNEVISSYKPDTPLIELSLPSSAILIDVADSVVGFPGVLVVLCPDKVDSFVVSGRPVLLSIVVGTRGGVRSSVVVGRVDTSSMDSVWWIELGDSVVLVASSDVDESGGINSTTSGPSEKEKATSIAVGDELMTTERDGYSVDDDGSSTGNEIEG